MAKLRFLALAALTTLAGCDAADSGPAPSPSAPPSTPPVPGGRCAAADPAIAGREAEELFAYPTVPTFDFWLPPEEWAALKQNARDEQYTDVEACFEGKLVGTVGLRFKGSYGTLLSCFDHQGRLVCPKLSMKVDFGEYTPELRFFGQKRLNLHAMRWDNTRLRERLAYDTFRAMDVLAPRTAWALVRVNGNVEGMFSMVEQIDGRFTDDRFPEGGDGNLYKEAWPVSVEPEDYRERLENNEETASVDAVVAFARALDEPSASARLEALGRATDLDYLARYMAVDDALANYDGVTAFYVSDDRLWTANHNFYLYEEEHRPFFWLIPWDLDSTLTLNPVFERIPRWNVTPADCSAVYPVWGDSQVYAPGCDPLLSALAADIGRYRAAARQLLSGPFAEAALLEQIDRHAAFLEPAIALDPNGPTLEGWRAEVSWLRSQVPVLRDRFARVAEGLPITSMALETMSVNDFEALDEFALLTGSTAIANPGSSIARAVNRSEPLSGAADIVLTFDYRNDSVAWGQWLYFNLPFAGALTDLSGLEGIRLKVRADRARTLRIEIESPDDTNGEHGVHFGWDVPIGPLTSDVEVRFADARVPSWASVQGLDPGDDRTAILRKAAALLANPSCEGRDSTGYLPTGFTDSGRVQFDDIEFF